MLTTIVSVDPLWVYFDCDEQSYLRFQQSARRGSGVGSDNPVRVALANEEGFPHVGHIDFVDNALNPSTGTIRARCTQNPNHTLTPACLLGCNCRVRNLSEAILIDDKAVLTDQDRKYVYVVGPDDKAQRKDIILGGSVDGLRVVKSGLSSDDKVIVGGLQQIYFPGAPIKAKTVTMESLVAQSDKPAAAGIEVRRGPWISQSFYRPSYLCDCAVCHHLQSWTYRNPYFAFGRIP